MSYRIGKTLSFEAAHHLPGLPEGHKCGRSHGHSYQVTVVLAADDLVPPGFVVDFGDLSPLRSYIDDQLDHRNLNDVLDIPPTSERLARHFYDWCVEHLPLHDGVTIGSVRVSETAATFAEYTPPVGGGDR
ncbi:6-pyruvoyl trahydropterin synthase family protein [Actinocatenispora comari]|jgi:6-pyruvoyltetrahydropterin/6-carboxytetrahydropterin synthase|uniref:6-carboxy-5,6,7,8-tetrahydropterin synthase n=1 Tax=Actinocatenispora comari TaxID=2807577 RepID=A0A8J4AE83_9ACTN|nr:6-carboxytetrahydropterin synthase [Actinocatenispora comari]GIL29055.1 6-carboxy-5,6,7,8-tetrahydropterin synthase [Actinocatenispora comari]